MLKVTKGELMEVLEIPRDSECDSIRLAAELRLYMTRNKDLAGVLLGLADTDDVDTAVVFWMRHIIHGV